MPHKLTVICPPNKPINHDNPDNYKCTACGKKFSNLMQASREECAF